MSHYGKPTVHSVVSSGRVLRAPNWTVPPRILSVHERVWRAWLNLPNQIHRSSTGPGTMTYHNACILIYEFLSNTAIELGFEDVYNGPNDFVNINMPNFKDVTEPVKIVLMPRNPRGQEFVRALEELETVVELGDWHQ